VCAKPLGLEKKELANMALCKLRNIFQRMGKALSVRIVAFVAEPEKSATRESNPPGEISWPAAFVPPPKPHVCTCIVDVEDRVNVCWNALSGEAKVPVSEMEVTLARAKGFTANMAKSNAAVMMGPEILFIKVFIKLLQSIGDPTVNLEYKLQSSRPIDHWAIINNYPCRLT
jgi:hypothetical protein